MPSTIPEAGTVDAVDRDQPRAKPAAPATEAPALLADADPAQEGARLHSLKLRLAPEMPRLTAEQPRALLSLLHA